LFSFVVWWLVLIGI